MKNIQSSKIPMHAVVVSPKKYIQLSKKRNERHDSRTSTELQRSDCPPVPCTRLLRPRGPARVVGRCWKAFPYPLLSTPSLSGSDEGIENGQ